MTAIARACVAVLLSAACAGNPCPSDAPLWCSSAGKCCAANEPYHCGSKCYSSSASASSACGGTANVETCTVSGGQTTAQDCHSMGLLCCDYGCPANKCCPSTAPYGCGDNLGVWDCWKTQQDASYEVSNGVCRKSIGGSGSYFLCN